MAKVQPHHSQPCTAPVPPGCPSVGVSESQPTSARRRSTGMSRRSYVQGIVRMYSGEVLSAGIGDGKDNREQVCAFFEQV